MKYLLTTILFVATLLKFSSVDCAGVLVKPPWPHTSIEPGDYTIHGKVVCKIPFTPCNENAIARLWEGDPITFDDVVQQVRIGRRGNFTFHTISNMHDFPTPKWELYIEFENPCFEQEFSLYTPIVVTDDKNEGLTTTYIIDYLPHDPKSYYIDNGFWIRSPTY
uniref:Uncharacterized protein n=2 Tax=Panagrolaimus davidi TaxID=227884 RepID=A0A914P0P3_9BILA